MSIDTHEHYFPFGIAQDEAFLGREAEIAHIQNNIRRGYHTLLLSPRRYGKTSLVKHVIQQLAYPAIEIDLFVAPNALSVEQKFIKGVQEVISQIAPPTSWMKMLVQFFKQADKTWTVGFKGLSLELIPETHQDVADNILCALNALEYVLSKKKKIVIIFVDEMQAIAELDCHAAIEGAIRHFAQSAKHVHFIFSGSHRHMLTVMFTDKSRPLYALCDPMHLIRLAPELYCVYLNMISKKTWHQPLPTEVFDVIMTLTAVHPRYVYLLCAYLWENNLDRKKPPTAEDVRSTWHQLMKLYQKDNRELLSKMSSGQLKILSFISNGTTSELTGQVAQSKLKMSGSAITQALRTLEQMDYVEKLPDSHYRLIDPLLQMTLIEYASDYFLD